jgi:hypothetical protein
MPGNPLTAAVVGAALGGGRDVDAAAEEWWACDASAPPPAADVHPASTVTASAPTTSRENLPDMNRVPLRCRTAASR